MFAFFSHPEITRLLVIFGRLWNMWALILLASEPLPRDPNRHPITPVRWFKCYVSTFHLESDHIHCLIEWQDLCVCLRMRGWELCVNSLMWVPSCGVCFLRLTALWQSEWHWGHRASPQLCHLWALLEKGHALPVSVVTKEMSSGANSPPGLRLWWRGLLGGYGKLTDTDRCLCLMK